MKQAVQVDLFNPGQFFACCGLLELGHRRWADCTGWFENNAFYLEKPDVDDPVSEVIRLLQNAELVADSNAEDSKTSPLLLGNPFGLRLDWWQSEEGIEHLKTWAGQQSVGRIACAMKAAIPEPKPGMGPLDVLQQSLVVRSEGETVEPFYFDATRHADRLDTGFSLDRQDAEVAAHPASEVLCLIGLQRFRPDQVDEWTFAYAPWMIPLSAIVASAWVSGTLGKTLRLHFPVLFRDERKRYKAFGFADHT